MVYKEVSCGCPAALGKNRMDIFLRLVLTFIVLVNSNVLTSKSNDNSVFILQSVRPEKDKNGSQSDSFDSIISPAYKTSQIVKTETSVIYKSSEHVETLSKNSIVSTMKENSILSQSSVILPTLSQITTSFSSHQPSSSTEVIIPTSTKTKITTLFSSQSLTEVVPLLTTSFSNESTGIMSLSLSTFHFESSKLSSRERISTVIVSSSFIKTSSVIPSSCYIVIKTETVCASSSFMPSITMNSSFPISSRAENSSFLSLTSQLQTSLKPTLVANSTTAAASYSATTKLTSLVSSISSLITSSSHIASTSSAITPSSSTMVIISAFVLQPSKKTCDIVASNFSIALNNYTTCILTNLKPMEVCFKCVNEYDKMRLYHRKVYHDCGKKLIGNYNARYQVIAQLFQMQQKTWDSLQCEKCFNRESQSPVPNPSFLKFKKLDSNIRKCFHFHGGSGNKTVNGSIVNKNESVCTECSSLYSQLQSQFKYQEDSEENRDTMWCADINVAVNNTRHLWSGTYHCGAREKDLASIIALTCFFCFLPIVFYVGAKLHADVKERKTNRYYESE